MYGIYTNIGGIWMGSMLPYIAAPWILWESAKVSAFSPGGETPIGQSTHQKRALAEEVPVRILGIVQHLRGWGRRLHTRPGQRSQKTMERLERSSIFHGKTGKTHDFDWAMFKFAKC